MATAKKSQILIVDDYPTNIKVLSDLLIEYGFEVLIARDGENALQKLQRILPDIILLDVLMPGIDGFETCRRLKEQESTQDIPVIFMTALADPVDKIKGLTLGAVDYITKPFQQEEVLARVNTHLKMRFLTKQLEEQNAQLQEEVRSRQIAESTLRLSEEKFAKAFRSNPGPMMILSLEGGRFIDINYNFCVLLDYPPEAVVGKTIEELKCCRGADLDCFYQTLRDSGSVQGQECQFYTRTGEMRFLLVSAEIIRVRDLPCILAMMSDITLRKQATVELQHAKDVAEIANQAKTRFLANMSHELRTPLNTILGFTQLMSRDVSLNPEQQENLSIINRSGEHLLTLINDVLEMTKIEAGQVFLHKTDFNLCALLDMLYIMLEPKAEEKGLQFMFELAPNLPARINTDETKLRQILINLVGNGIKFTEKGYVTLRIGLGNGEDGGGAPYPAFYSLQFEVEDSGPGIAPSEIETLFDPFVQTEAGRKSQEGTGLGLPISRRFVQLMGGDITVDSSLGTGSVFRFEIQVAAAEVTITPLTQPQRQIVGLAPNQPSYRILVAEDRLANRQLLVKLLTSVGFEVREAVNGDEAIALYQNWQPNLIWMDVRMPEMDGYEATRRIKLMQQETTNSVLPEAENLTVRQGYPVVASKIIALTANAFEEERLTALAAGFDDFVRKPIREEILFEKIEEHLGVRYLYEDTDLKKPELNSPNVAVNRANSFGDSPFVIGGAARENLYEMLGGDGKFLETFIASYIKDLRRLIQMLKSAISNQSAADLSLAAHSMKGIGMTFGADHFSRLCQAIELTAGAGTSSISQKQLTQLETELKRLIAGLELERKKIRVAGQAEQLP